MNFPSVSLKHLLVVFGCLFVTAIIFVSILGENNNGVNATRIFLGAVKDRDFAELNRSYSHNSPKFDSSAESTRYHFLVELAMLDHFKLLEADDYRVKISTDTTWFPFISGKYLHMNVRLSPVDSTTFFESGGTIPPIERAVTAVRENGRWKIYGFNLEDSELEKYYDKIVAEVNYDKFINMANGEITLQQQAINLQEMNGLDRRVFIHSLQNAIENTRDSLHTREDVAAVH